MHNKNLSVALWEEVLVFLNKAGKQYYAKAFDTQDLVTSAAYKDKEREIYRARRVLLSLCLEVTNYIKTGKFEPQEIILHNKCTKCGK